MNRRIFVHSSLNQGAVIFAMTAHNGQRRKYSDAPYVLHPINVARRVSEWFHDYGFQNRADRGDHLVMTTTALLHDVLEDTKTDVTDLTAVFGPIVTGLVCELTNTAKYEHSDRATVKRMDRERLAKVSPMAKIIKMHDRIDNLEEIVDDPAPDSFKVLYAQESIELVKAIGDADHNLEEKLNKTAVELITRITARTLKK